jgi:hypothetical protein
MENFVRKQTQLVEAEKQLSRRGETLKIKSTGIRSVLGDYIVDFEVFSGTVKQGDLVQVGECQGIVYSVGDTVSVLFKQELPLNEDVTMFPC